jgi:hypothetical protein
MAQAEGVSAMPEHLWQREFRERCCNHNTTNNITIQLCINVRSKHNNIYC